MLMEPITYANGSTLDDPAITYGIVFSNFMGKGVYTFKGGTSELIKKMKKELLKNGVDIRTHCLVNRIVVDADKTVRGVEVQGRMIPAKTVLSNSNLLSTIHKLTGDEHFTPEFLAEVKKVRLSDSSCQVYIGIKKGEKIDNVGDLLFTSQEKEFSSESLLEPETTSRTFSFYYPEIRPGLNMYSIVSSTNARFKDWAHLTRQEYEEKKSQLIERTLVALEKYVPGVRKKIGHLEASTPMTFMRYTTHPGGVSFGTKFEGLMISKNLPKQIAGLFHAGSVGIIMSGWLGAANYGVIVANEVDKFLFAARQSPQALETAGV